MLAQARQGQAKQAHPGLAQAEIKTINQKLIKILPRKVFLKFSLEELPIF